MRSVGIREGVIAVAIVAGVMGCGSGSSAPIGRHLQASTNQPTGTPHPDRQPTRSFSPTQALVSQARWVHYPEGWRLEVTPSIYGRNHSPEAVRETLAEALQLAPPPLHLTHTMRRSLYNQLACHADFAPRKPLWDLESWRPNVGYYRTVEALCNPGGGF
jgi:hypothetical protein